MLLPSDNSQLAINENDGNELHCPRAIKLTISRANLPNKSVFLGLMNKSWFDLFLFNLVWLDSTFCSGQGR